MIKTRLATKKEILNGFKNVIAISYGCAQNLLHCVRANYYTYSKVHGWQADVYIIDNDTAIVTGYAPFGNVKVDYALLKEYEKKAERVYYTVNHYDDRTNILKMYLIEFIEKTINGGKL